jgi:hypothetical protein
MKSFEDTAKLEVGVEAIKGNLLQVTSTAIAKLTTKTAKQEALVMKSIEDTAKLAAEVELLKGNPVGLSGGSQTIIELQEIDKQKNNLAIFGLKKSDDPGSDQTRVDDLLRAIIGGNVKNRVLFRSGKKEPSKMRPLIVKMDDCNVKQKILSNTKILKDDLAWKRVFVNPDYTSLQRKTFQEQEKLIKSEAGKRNLDLKNVTGRELWDAGWRWELRGRWGQCHLTKVKSTSA